jgi:hypothetical protein
LTFSCFPKLVLLSVADFREGFKVISTRTIPTLRVTNDKGQEISGLGNQISGMDWDSFELTIEGIPYPLYGDEFPHHVKAEEERFK